MRIAAENHIDITPGDQHAEPRDDHHRRGHCRNLSGRYLSDQLANHMAGQQVANFDLNNFMETNRRKILISGEKAISVPGQISDFLSLANKGQLKSIWR